MGSSQNSRNLPTRTTRAPTRRTTRRTTTRRTTTRRTTTRRPTTNGRTTTGRPTTTRRPTSRPPSRGPVRVPVKSNRALVKAEDNFIDDVFEEDESQGAGGWVLPPSLMAVAAVPGAPVINTQADTRVPKDVKEEVREMDPYLRFMPVPA